MVQRDLSLVILSHNREAGCREIVNNISAMKLPFLREIIIVDNGSDKPYKIKKCRVVRFKENMLVPMARNFCVRQCKTKYVMMMDDDNEINKESINLLHWRLNIHRDYDIVFPTKIDIYRNGLVKEYSYFKTNVFGGLSRTKPKKPGRLYNWVEFGGHVYMGYKDKIYYDEDFGITKRMGVGYAIREESSMHAKLLNKRAVPEAVALHFADKYSGGYVPLKKHICYWTGHGNALFLKRYKSKFRAIIWLCTYGIAYVLKHRNFEVIIGWWDGYK